MSNIYETLVERGIIAQCTNEEKVKEILINKTYPYRRLLMSFPDMKVFNKLSILKDKLRITRKEIKAEKEKSRKLSFNLLKNRKKKVK